MKKFFYNIAQIYGVNHTQSPLKGRSQMFFESISNAFLTVNGGIIEDFGVLNDEVKTKYSGYETIDLQNQTLFPGFCDSHTHLVFAGSRETEFAMKIDGKSYEEIAQAGGGILNSAQKLAQTSEDTLVESASKRIKEIIGMGTAAVEIKSGYGLATEQELKMLRVIKKLKTLFPQIEIKSTFLGAHSIPMKYRNNPEAYVDLIINEMLPKVAEENLAEYCDVFCDKGFFNPQQTEKILTKAIDLGLKPKIHANELDYSGGIQVGVKCNAVSVDHLEFTGEAEIEALKKSNTIATLLPSTAFFLGLQYPPARKIIDSNIPVALASDYNPGSSPSGNMSFVISLACIKLKMKPEEAFNAATINGSFAMEIQNKLGSIAKGKFASFFTVKDLPSLAFIPYSFGSKLINEVYLKGEKQ